MRTSRLQACTHGHRRVHVDLGSPPLRAVRHCPGVVISDQLIEMSTPLSLEAQMPAQGTGRSEALKTRSMSCSPASFFLMFFLGGGLALSTGLCGYRAFLLGRTYSHSPETPLSSGSLRRSRSLVWFAGRERAYLYPNPRGACGGRDSLSLAPRPPQRLTSEKGTLPRTLTASTKQIPVDTMVHRAAPHTERSSLASGLGPASSFRALTAALRTSFT